MAAKRIRTTKLAQSIAKKAKKGIWLDGKIGNKRLFILAMNFSENRWHDKCAPFDWISKPSHFCRLFCFFAKKKRRNHTHTFSLSLGALDEPSFSFKTFFLYFRSFSLLLNKTISFGCLKWGDFCINAGISHLPNTYITMKTSEKKSETEKKTMRWRWW